jgi:polyferredoxin
MAVLTLEMLQTSFYNDKRSIHFSHRPYFLVIIFTTILLSLISFISNIYHYWIMATTYGSVSKKYSKSK